MLYYRIHVPVCLHVHIMEGCHGAEHHFKWCSGSLIQSTIWNEQGVLLGNIAIFNESIVILNSKCTRSSDSICTNM